MNERIMVDGMEMSPETARQCLANDNVNQEVQNLVLLSAAEPRPTAPEGHYWRRHPKTGEMILVRKGREAMDKEPGDSKKQKIGKIKELFMRIADANGVVDLDNLDQKNLQAIGMTRRGLLVFLRHNKESLGGSYTPSRKIPGNPRAFRDVERQTRWTAPRFRLDQIPSTTTAGQPPLAPPTVTRSPEPGTLHAHVNNDPATEEIYVSVLSSDGKSQDFFRFKEGHPAMRWTEDQIKAYCITRTEDTLAIKNGTPVPTGHEITWTSSKEPGLNSQGEMVREQPITGYVLEQIHDQAGGVGYHLAVRVYQNEQYADYHPESGGAFNRVRVWQDQGSLESTGKVADWLLPPRKEAHQMTLGQWEGLSDTVKATYPREEGSADPSHSNYHLFQVIKALQQGKQVPQEVLRDYPDATAHVPVIGGRPMTTEEYRQGLHLPYKPVQHLISNYKAAGLDKQRAWGQFIQDTQLQRRLRSDDVDARDFFHHWDRS